MSKKLWKPVKWIFFDLDDTIWDFSGNSHDSLIKLYEISPILRKLFPSIDEFIKIYHSNNSLMWDLYAKGEVTTKQLKVERWRRTLATRQFEVLTAVCEELDTNYLEILAKGKRMLPGIKEVMGNLSDKFMLAVLSNGFSKTQYQKLYYSGLDRFITRTIVSEEIGINKPDSRLFSYAINETGARPPFLMVGDNAENDILGAMSAGWYAIWMNKTGNPFPFSNEDILNKGINPELLIAQVETAKEMETAILDFMRSYEQ